MSAAGLPMKDHIAEHFNGEGLCQCPCDECTSRAALFCLCVDCPCDPEGPAHHMPPAADVEWITVPGLRVRGGPPFSGRVRS